MGADLCGGCGALLTLMTYKKSLRLKCKDGLYRQRQRTMKRLRCLECSWVKPTVLGVADLDPQASVRGCGKFAQILNPSQDDVSACGNNYNSVSDCGKGDVQTTSATPDSDCV